MSGIEILGALASTAQLVVYSLKIAAYLTEVQNKTKFLSRDISSHKRHVHEPIAITTLIRQNTSLQCPIIHVRVKATLREAHSLYQLLQEIASKSSRKLLWKYWSIIEGQHEKKLFLFDRLERQKSALALSISVARTEILQSIQCGIDRLSTIAMSPNDTTAKV